jgi:radical SAM-linked protein
VQRLTIVFRKGEEARFLSHLDLLATLEYSLRRARLPLELSEGFNPRPRMSIAAALPLGHVGERELLEIALREEVACEEVEHRLQAAVPPGLTILSVEPTKPDRKSAASRLRSVHYRADLAESIDDLSQRVEALLALASLEVTEERDGKSRVRNVRPLILSAAAISATRIDFRLQLDGSGTVRPEQLLEAMHIPLEGTRYTREKIRLAE